MVTNISKRRVALLPALAGIVALAVAISAGIASTPSGAGAGIASASSGGWVLKGSETHKEAPDHPGDCYSGQEVTIAGLSATTYVRCTSTGPTYDVYQRSQHSWSAAPPERLAPGEVLRISSTTSVEGTFHTVGMGGGASTWVRIDLVPGGGPYPGAGWANATEENTTVSADSEFSIPSGREGGLMLVTLRLQGVAGSGQTTYTYEWQGTASGATPGPTGTGRIDPTETTAPRPTEEPLGPCHTPPGADSGARFSSISKEVEVFPESDPGAIFSAKPNTVLRVDDHVLTGEESHAVITFADLSTLAIKEESEIVIDCPELRSNRVDYRRGTFWLKVKKLILGDAIEVKTNLVTMGIRGTTLVTEVTDDATTLKVLEGNVEFTSLATGETVMVGAGETVSATAGGLSEKGTFDVEAESALWPLEGGDGLPALVIVAGVFVLVSLAGLIFARQRKQGT